MQQYLELLDEFGPWGADRGALDLLTTIEKEKIRTPCERHFLLLCMVSTVLVQARSMAAGVFSRYTTEMERIRRYSTPKVRRLLEVLAWFGEHQARPNDQHTSNASTTLQQQQQQQQQTMYCFCRTVECKELGREYHTFGSRIGDVGERIDRLAKQLHTVRHATDRLMLKHRNRDGGSSEMNSGSSPRHHSTAQPHTDGRPGNLRRRRCFPGAGIGSGGGPPWLNGAMGHHQRGHDTSSAGATEALCGLIFCNDRSIARILYVLLYEVARSQPEFAFLSAQYTVDKVVDPLTDAQHAALEHRKQEEVLKRFRMHEASSDLSVLRFYKPLALSEFSFPTGTLTRV